CQTGRRVYPEDAELLFLEGQLCQHFDRFPAAERAYRELLERPHQDYLSSFDHGILGFRTRHHLAEVLLKLDRCDEAESLWREVVKESPAFVPAWHALLELLMRQGRGKLVHDAAEQMFQTPSVRGWAHVWR